MTNREYRMLSWYKKLGVDIVRGLKGAGLGIVHFFMAIPRVIVRFFKAIGGGLAFYGRTFVHGDALTKLSYIVMGAGNLFRGQIIKGLLYLIAEAAYLFYMIVAGGAALGGLLNLGTKTQGMIFDEAQGIDIMQMGDNSMMILLFGVFAVMISTAFLIIYISSIKASKKAQDFKAAGKHLPTFIEDFNGYKDENFHKTLLSIPTMGVLIFTILPLIFMISIAFTNFDNKHQPPGNLFTWTGLGNFETMLFSGTTIANTFWPVLGWTLVWAFFATVLNYIFGILLAMLINKKEIKCKGLFRTCFVMSIAVPQFVSLLVMRNMLNDNGPINVLLKQFDIIDKNIPFLTTVGIARVVLIVVNLWIGVPYTMLSTTGILMNIPEDLYESARIDGASGFIMFIKITMPYVLFVTTPYLITQFIGNINNFNVIYLLTGGGPNTLDYYQAGKTDLLVTWLYKLTVNSKDYCYASTIGIIVFVLSAVFSLIVYRNTGSYKNEEEFQ